MFIALAGAPCAGKHAVARFLELELGFQRTHLANASAIHHSAPALDATQPAAQAADDLVFDDADALLEYATVHWRKPLLTLDLVAEADIRAFLKRPFFLLVGVQAPLGLRWQRYQTKYAGASARIKTLEQFITLDDRLVYGISNEANKEEDDGAPCSSSSKRTAKTATAYPGVALASSQQLPLSPPASSSSAASLDRSLSSDSSFDISALRLRRPSDAPGPLASILPQATLVLTNAHTSLADLHTSLHALNLPTTLPTFLRPAWDHYFLSLCTLASLRSNCMKRRVGAVLVRANRVLSTGYNGTPRGMRNCNEGGCGRCNGGAPGGARLDECLCLHAEENALLECGRERGGAEGTVLYCNTCPCLRCAVKIVQTGVREVVYELDYSMDDHSRQIFEEAGIEFRKCSLPTAQR